MSEANEIEVATEGQPQDRRARVSMVLKKRHLSNAATPIETSESWIHERFVARARNNKR